MGSIGERIGHRVRDYRKAKKLTQLELARRISVSSETISRLERGVVMPSLDRLHGIAMELDVELHELLRIDNGSAKANALARLMAVASQGEASDVEALAAIAEVVIAQLQRSRDLEKPLDQRLQQL